MKKLFSSIFMALISFCACAVMGCAPKGETVSAVYDPSKNQEYYVKDIVKENMIFDTEKLFNEQTAYQNAGISALPQNMTAIRFDSEAFPRKHLEKTQPFAVIGKPETEMPEGGYPAIVLVHGGTGYVFTDWIEYWTEKGYVAIALDLFGNELNTELLKSVNIMGGPSETQSGSVNDDPEDAQNSWVYHSVCNVIRCNNILRSLDYVNENQIGVTGISWGGFITCIVSGVDKRFAAFAPVYGSGYIFESSRWTGRFGGEEGTEGRQKWIECYDPSSYLPYATKPMLFVAGIDDNAFSVLNRVKSYGLVPAKTFYSQRSNYTHGHLWEQSYEIYAFMEHILLGKDTMMEIRSASHDDGKAYVELENPERVGALRLVYTTSTDADSFKWTFETQELTVQEGVVEVELPEGVTAFAFECLHTTELYFRSSSKIFLVNG